MAFPTGVIHGRFQVVHHDHVKYILAGLELANHLYIGITNPDPRLTKDETTAVHRSARVENPLVYHERHAMIRAVLDGENVPPARYTIVPFPISFPDLYSCYVPVDAVFFLTIHDDWGRKKLDYFRSLNLNVRVLWEGTPETKGIRGTMVRALIARGDPAWEDFVPAATARLVRAWHLERRLGGG